MRRLINSRPIEGEMVTAIEEGLLSRAFFLAAKPDPRSTMKRSE